MFGASVTGLTLVSFALMVGSSIIAAWSDIRHAVTSAPVLDPITGLDIAAPAHTIGGVNIGYIWMALNCFASAAYVLYMRKRIKITGFKDWDSMMYNNVGVLHLWGNEGGGDRAEDRKGQEGGQERVSPAR
jgi:GDP-mannose transporter